MKKRTVALLLAIVLVIGCGIGRTLAWLLDVDGEVQNTFTTSDVDIDLTESDSVDDTDTDADNNTYKMIPGHKITKDPKVTVKATSEPCYVFVEVEETGGNITVTENGDSVKKSFEDFIIYAIADGWIQGTGDGEGRNGVPINVYYREIEEVTSTNTSFTVIGNRGLDGKATTFENDVVLVNPTVTKAMLEELAKNSTQEPKLNFYAYASQLYETNEQKFDVGEAWDLVKELRPADVTP